jgi:hypothetical protein
MRGLREKSARSSGSEGIPKLVVFIGLLVSGTGATITKSCDTSVTTLPFFGAPFNDFAPSSAASAITALTDCSLELNVDLLLRAENGLFTTPTFGL